MFFKRLVLQTRKNQGLFGKGLTYIILTQSFVTWQLIFEILCTCVNLQIHTFDYTVYIVFLLFCVRLFSSFPQNHCRYNGQWLERNESCHNGIWSVWHYMLEFLLCTCRIESFLFLPAIFLFQLTPFPNKPWFLRVCSTNLLKTLWEKEKLLIQVITPFLTVFSTLLINFPPFSSNLKLLPANSFSLEESKICRLGKG